MAGDRAGRATAGRPRCDGWPARTRPTAPSTSTSAVAGWPARSRASASCGRRPTGSRSASRPSPAEVVATWRRDFGSFWPPGNRFYGPFTGLEPGEVALLNLTMPGGLELSTGVLVLYADEEGFTLMTPEGHQFAGWITFNAFTRRRAGTTAQAQVLMRSSDPIYEIGMAFGGHRVEDRFWAATLTALAASFGVAPRSSSGARGVRRQTSPMAAGRQRPLQRRAPLGCLPRPLPGPPHAEGELTRRRNADATPPMRGNLRPRPDLKHLSLALSIAGRNTLPYGTVFGSARRGVRVRSRTRPAVS